MSKYIKLFFHVTFLENGLLCHQHLDHLQLNQLYYFFPLSKSATGPLGLCEQVMRIESAEKHIAQWELIELETEGRRHYVVTDANCCGS